MAKLPYFPFYPADWLSSPNVMCASLEEQGAYIRLLCACWLSPNCSIPNDNKKLSILSGLPEHMLTFVHIMFTKHPSLDGALTNKRLLDEWVKATRVSLKRAKAGEKSGKSRRTNVHHLFKQNTNKTRTHVEQMPPYSDSYSDSYSESEAESEIKKEIKKNCIPAKRVAGGETNPMWEAYSEAFTTRYGFTPLRGAAENGMLARLLKTIPREDAPEVARFYVRHNDMFYIKKQHEIKWLLQNAVNLHTQWKTGQSITSSQARKVDETQGRLNVFQEIINEREREAQHVETA